MNEINIFINEKIKRLFFESKARHNILLGGRGGGKSFGVADTLILLGLSECQDIPCLREFQSSLKDSTRSQIINSINNFNNNYHLNIFYNLTNNEVVLQNGTVFKFYGISDSTGTTRKVKSLLTEKTKYVWIEEAQTLSENSFSKLKDSIRGTGSRIFYTMNPTSNANILMRLKNEITDKEQVDYEVINYMDNPFFPEVLKKEMDIDKKLKTDEQWRHNWLGEIYNDNACLIQIKTIEKALKETFIQDDYYIFGIDLATGEATDSSILTIINRFSIIDMIIIKENNPRDICNKIYEYYLRYKPQIVNIDKGNMGWAICKQLTLEYGLVNNAVDFGGGETTEYANNRAKMYNKLNEYLLNGFSLCFPLSREQQPFLVQELENVLIDIDKNKLQLRKKEEIKKLIHRSPDRADSLALCFYLEFNKKRYENFVIRKNELVF
jgi:PBSX family phage terminase large subunit